METKFPKSILEENFVLRNRFTLDKNSNKIENIRSVDERNENASRLEASSSNQPPSFSAVKYRDSYEDNWMYYHYNYDYIWWLYVCDSTHGYYPISFYNRYYYYSGAYGGGDAGGVSVYSGGDVSGGGGTVDDAVIGEETDEAIEIDGGDGGEQNGGFDDGAGHDTFVDGADADGDGGDGVGE